MKTTWLRQWNRWQFLTTQLTLISVLFLYAFISSDPSLVVSLFLVITLSWLHTQWIGATLYSLIDHARLQGNFKVMRNTVIVHYIHLIAGFALFIASYVVASEWLGAANYRTLGMLVIVLVGLDKVLSATLRAQASEIVLQAHALRRGMLLGGLIVGLIVQSQPWFDLVLFGALIVSPLSSVLRLFIGFIQTYKEFRYRRQFEDSGNKQSLFAVFGSLTTRYASSSVQIALPFGLLVVLGLVTQFVDVPQTTTSLAQSLSLLVVVIAVARTLLSTVTPDTSQWKQYVQANNHSVLRAQLSTISEQLLYRSLIVGLAWFGVGFLLGPSVYDTLASLLGSTAVVMVSSFYLFNQRILGLLGVAQQWLIVITAIVIFGLNALLLFIYYPSVALMISWVMTVGWIHFANVYVWSSSFDFEWRIHLKQSAIMVGIATSALIVNALIYWLLVQFPLGVDPFVEMLVFFGLFVIITSVVMYSLTYALGIHRSLQSRTEILQQLATQFMEYEEEEAIW